MKNNGLLQTSAKTFASTFGITAATFVTSMLTARQLGPDGRGALAAFALVATLAAGAAQLGVANAYIYKKRSDPAVSYGWLALAGWIAVALLAPVLALVIEREYGSAVFNGHLPLLLLLAGLGAALLCTNTLAQADDSLGAYNLGRAVVPFCLLAYAGAMQVLAVRPSYADYVMVQTGLTLLALLVVSPSLRRLVARPSTVPRQRDARGFLGYATKHHANALVGIVVMNIDKLFLLHRAAPREFGFYVLAYSTTRLLATVQDSISTAIYARHAGRDEAALSSAVRRAFRLTLLPMLVVAAAATLTAPLLIRLVFGERFLPMALPFSILTFEAVIGAASWTLTQRLVGGGRPGLMLLRNVSLLVIFLAVFQFLPQASLINSLAYLMLGLSLLRLGLSLAIFPVVLKEPLPQPIPTLAELGELRRVLLRRAPDA